jgi:predicted unusual protein kinase regulating ubiquinone biosynthesis (AarF/ABC1/UbiB family)
MTDLTRLLHNPGLSSSALDKTQFAVGQDHELTTKQQSATGFGRVLEWGKNTFSAEQKNLNRAGFDAYVSELKKVNQELGTQLESKLQKIKTDGKPLTLRAVQRVLTDQSHDNVLTNVKSQADHLIHTLKSAGQNWPQYVPQARVTQLRQTLEVMQMHLRGAGDLDSQVAMAGLCRQIDQLTGDSSANWIVPEAQLGTKGQELLKVFHPHLGKLVDTPVSNTQWRTMLKAHDELKVGNTLKNEQAVRHSAMSIIKSTGLHSGLRFLEKAPTAALVDLARQAGHGVYTEFDILHDVQAEDDAKVLDPDSLRLLKAYNASTAESKARIQLDAPTPTVAAAGAKPAKPKQESQDPAFKQEFQQVKDLRAFFAECLSPSNPADLQTLSSADRLKKACVSNADKFASIFTLPSEGNPEVPPEVVEAMYALVDDATFSKLQEAQAQGAWADSEAILQQHFSSLPAERFESLNTAIDQSMSAFKAPVTQVLYQLSEGFEGVPGNLANFLSLAFRTYYENQAPVDQKSMVASYMRGSVEGSSDVQKLASLVAGGGPYMIKMLQLVGDNVSGENAKDIKDALAFVKSGLPPIAPDIRNAMLLGIVNDSNGKITALQGVRSLGAASVGETFLTRVNKDDGSSETAVVKLLRPGIAQRAGRERVFMDSVAKMLPGMQGTFAGIADQIEAEMDLTSEAANVRLGAVYDGKGNPYVQSMKLSDAAPAKTNYMMIQKAPGSTAAHYLEHLSRHSDRTPIHPMVLANRMGAMMNDLAEKWVEEAIFGSGFYHGDLHSGNIMYKADEGSENGTLTVIDFGNSKVLNPTERRAIFRMMCTAEIKSAPDFCRDFETILSAEGKSIMTGDKRTAFLSKIEEAFNKTDPETGMTASTGTIIDSILTSANDLGIEVPGAIANFSRSEMMLENAFKDITKLSKANWESFRDLKARDPQLTAEMKDRTSRLGRHIDRKINDLGKQNPVPIDTIEKLKSIKATLLNESQGFVAMEAADIDFLLELDAPLPQEQRILEHAVNRLKQTIAVSQQEVPNDPAEFSIEKAIGNVLARNMANSLNLTGLDLARRMLTT